MKIAFLTPEYPHPKTGNSGGIGTRQQNRAVHTAIINVDYTTTSIAAALELIDTQQVEKTNADFGKGNNS